MISRRAFCLSGPLSAGAALLSISGAAPTHGRVDVARWHADGYRQVDARVLLDGRDVTADCLEFDDESGYATLLNRNERGQAFVDRETMRPARQRHYGKGTVV